MANQRVFKEILTESGIKSRWRKQVSQSLIPQLNSGSFLLRCLSRYHGNQTASLEVSCDESALKICLMWLLTDCKWRLYSNQVIVVRVVVFLYFLISSFIFHFNAVPFFSVLFGCPGLSGVSSFSHSSRVDGQHGHLWGRASQRLPGQRCLDVPASSRWLATAWLFKYTGLS